MTNSDILLLGAVAYDPKVVTIWEGFKGYFARHNLSFDYILYSNYERQVESHLNGDFHVAWNSPLAWVRTVRIARSRGQEVEALADARHGSGFNFCHRRPERFRHTICC